MKPTQAQCTWHLIMLANVHKPKIRSNHASREQSTRKVAGVTATGKLAAPPMTESLAVASLRMLQMAFQILLRGGLAFNDDNAIRQVSEGETQASTKRTKAAKSLHIAFQPYQGKS
jgi:hypothetical protein